MELVTKDYLRTARLGKTIDDPRSKVGVQTLLRMLLPIDSKAPSWWSPARDEFLRNEVYRNPFLDSIVGTVTMKIMNLPIKVLSRDSGVEKYNRLAETYNDILIKSLAREQTLEKFIRSILTQDNGGFLYIQGEEPAHNPLTGIPTGLLHLDSTRCTRTGDPEYPVVFLDYDGRYYKIHNSRVIFCSQSPSTDAEMFGVGYCFVSRAMILAQHFLDVYAYEGEVLGSRSAEEIIWGTGVRSDDIHKAFDVAELESDNAGLTRHGKRVYMGLRDPNSKIGTLRLKNLPENFNKRDDIEITLTLIALASGGSPNWFYDSVRSGSTKASASESTKIGESKLELWYINTICNEIDYKFLPNSLMTLCGNFDEDNSGTKSKIKLNLSQTRKINIASGVTDIRTERELQLHRGEITRAQFEVLELKDGRTSNGLPLYTLYQTDEKTLRDLIYFTDNPLDFTENVKDENILDKIDEYWERAQYVALNARTINMQNYGLKAMYLLQWTRDQYEKLLGVSPRYEFNEGADRVVNGEIVSMPNAEQEPDENDVSVLPEVNGDNTLTTNDEVRSGINDDDVIDNNELMGKSRDEKLDKMFTTRHQREYRQKLRNIARQMWNQEITLDDFKTNYANVLHEAFHENYKTHLMHTHRVDQLAQFIKGNLRSDGGKLKDIYAIADEWILEYLNES